MSFQPVNDKTLAGINKNNHIANDIQPSGSVSWVNVTLEFYQNVKFNGTYIKFPNGQYGRLIDKSDPLGKLMSKNWNPQVLVEWK